jgi:hypothetical protein
MAGAAGPEQTRARYPDAEAAADRAGVRVCYEVCGTGQPAMLLPA